MTIGEFFVTLGFNADLPKLENFSKGISKLNRSLGLTTIAFSGAIYGLDRFLNGTIKSANTIQHVTDKTGLSLEQLRSTIAGLDKDSQMQLTAAFLSKAQINDVINLGRSINDLKLQFLSLKDQAIAQIAPQLTILINNFFKWLNDNGAKVRNVISSVAEGISIFAHNVGRAVGVVTRFLEKSLGFENGFKALIGIFLALWIAASPLRIVITGIVAVLDDFDRYMKGLPNTLGPVYQAIGNTVDKLKDLYNIISQDWPYLPAILGGAALLAFLVSLTLKGKLAAASMSVLNGAMGIGGKGNIATLVRRGGAAVGLSTGADFLKGKISTNDINDTSVSGTLGRYAESIVTGTANGAALGVAAGPQGAILGAVIGAVYGGIKQLMAEGKAATSNPITNITINTTGTGNTKEDASIMAEEIKRSMAQLNTSY